MQCFCRRVSCYSLHFNQWFMLVTSNSGFISDNVGGKTEKDNHEGVNSLLSEELEKLANGNSKV